MALPSPTLCNSFTPMNTCHLFFPTNPNSNLPFPRSKKLGFTQTILQLRLTPVKCSKSYSDFEQEQPIYPKPTEISWQKELANSIQLIGIVGNPVQIKHLSSGKALAWTRLGVKKSPTETFWISLTFWNEVAHVAFQHVEKGHRLYVCGRLVADTIEGDDEKQQTYYKVVVNQLNFIEKRFSPSSFYEPDTNSLNTGGNLGSSTKNQVGLTEELWQAFFANPLDWWDNRKNKRNLKYPDFKHKHTGEALWVEGKYNPSWVKSQLAILDSRMESFNASFPAKEATMSAALWSGDDYRPF